ncbi:Splicing factor 1 [Myotis brandtii]|uniref:Splicing factor 1 n=1 Tax=Myotis brandtii TaxID=109478 RepID=S7MQ99_MYOBR|nr:Splicing factor 1 [Myotis brandtii]
MATGANATPLDFPRKKRKRSRWNQDTMEQKTVIPGMPTVIPPGLTREQERAYIVQLQIEDLTRKLRTGDLGIPPKPEDRSPSPEPIYNSEGKRLNTREFRTRKTLEEERHNLITEMVALNPDFKPPADYKPPATRVSDKVMIPQDEYPEINFIGLLIGPRGNTLKNIEKECNAKIMIRGKGSLLWSVGNSSVLHEYQESRGAHLGVKSSPQFRTPHLQLLLLPVVQLQIEDLTRKLRTGDLGIPPNPEDRSPSPEPIYNSEGKRLNTREFRTRKKLEEERHNLITEMVALNPDFKPPADYKGNTLKNIEKECNAKIMIRGKGSVKEGKVGRKDGQMLPGEDEPLHALVTANTMENVKKAVEQIRNILKQVIETPEDQNDLRKMQLRELARLNGTLREDDNRILRPWQSSETRSITNTTVCTKCGGAGHIASDCKFQRPGDPQSAQDKARMDKEYLSLMAELGEAPVPASVGSTSGPASTPLASAPRPAAPANNPPPPSLMSTTQSRPPWMNSGPSESRPYHGMHGGGPGGPGGGPHSFPHPLPSLTGGHGGHPMQHNPNGPPPPWMQPPPPPMNQGPHPPGHHGPPPMGKYDAATAYGHDAATAAATQWATSSPAYWSSSSMATAAAAASTTPSAQQQYGFQYPLAMAAKKGLVAPGRCRGGDLMFGVVVSGVICGGLEGTCHSRVSEDQALAGWLSSVHMARDTTTTTTSAGTGSIPPWQQQQAAAAASPGAPQMQGNPTMVPLPPGSAGMMYAPPPPPPPPMDPSNFVTMMGMGVAGMPPFGMPPAPPPPPPQN